MASQKRKIAYSLSDNKIESGTKKKSYEQMGEVEDTITNCSSWSSSTPGSHSGPK